MDSEGLRKRFPDATWHQCDRESCRGQAWEWHPQTPDAYHSPSGWISDAVFYQIFPDRFAKSKRIEKPGNLEAWDSPPTVHGYKGGDLLGVVEHLDHLVDLGVTAIYFNPIFQAAANHRYHTHDYHLVDPLLGGSDAFDEMIAACREHGIRVVLDGVFNHASRGFFQFNDILENGASSPWRDWFHIHGYPLHPYDDHPANYEAWWGLKALPKFNTDNPEVREYLMGVGEYWAGRGIDGWRLDVPQEIGTEGFWEEFRQRARAINPNLYIVGEIWSDATAYVADGTRFDATMNYTFTSAAISFAVGSRVDPATTLDNPSYSIMPAIDATTYASRIEELLARYSREVTLANLNLLDSHDTARIMSIASEDRRSVELCLFLLLTFPGAPSIYYGTEIGLAGGTDPGSRPAFPWDEATWDNQLLRTTKELVALRQEHDALRSHEVRRMWPPEGAMGEMVYVFSRRGTSGELLIGALNASENRETLTAPASAIEGLTVALLWGEADLDVGDNNLRVSVPGRSAALWKVLRS